MRFRQIIAATGLIAATVIFGGVSEIVAEEERSIVSIGVEGNRYVESAAILERVGSKVGQAMSRKQISRDVRKLFATGFFADVHVEGEVRNDGMHLIYVVKENPVIADLAIEGNDEVVDKDLKPKLKLKPGRVYSEDLLRRDRATIRKAYLKKGFYQVNVTSKARKLSDGRIDVTLNVEEGQVTRIKQIRFIGNEAFSDIKLRDQLASKESDFASWVTDKDVFDRDRFTQDAQILQMHYLNNGYLDMTVESTRLSLTPDKSSFYLTFVLHEGIQYSVDQLDVTGDLIPSEKELFEAIVLESGELYSLDKLQKSLSTMTEKVGDEGYAFANVTPLFKRDLASRSVSITFDVEKGREVYVERINIIGNEKAEDKVARRELRQQEGARYSASDVKLSRERLQRTRLFSDARISLPKGSADDKVEMDIEVTEDKSGSFSAGAGYSQLEKFFMKLQVEEKNLLGKGYGANASAEVGAATQNVSVALTDSYFMDSNIGASISAYKTDTRLDSFTTYKQNSFGGAVGFGVPITELLTYQIGYRYDHSKLIDIPANSSILLLAQQGVQTTGEITQGLIWDTRDSALAPQSGHLEKLLLNVAGLGGSNRFIEADASASYYHSLGEGIVLNPNVSGKYIFGLNGREVPVNRRYSMGGVGSLRGFDSYGVSLRDPQTNDVLGGDKELKASMNLFFPIPYIETGGFRGVLFADAGLIWGDVDLTVGAKRLVVNSKFSAANIRTSAGIGLEWMSPVGPLAFSWGFPINKKPEDVTRNFEFALGMGF